jgi:hypothetical protein
LKHFSENGLNESLEDEIKPSRVLIIVCLSDEDIHYHLY